MIWGMKLTPVLRETPKKQARWRDRLPREVTSVAVKVAVSGAYHDYLWQAFQCHYKVAHNVALMELVEQSGYASLRDVTSVLQDLIRLASTAPKDIPANTRFLLRKGPMKGQHVLDGLKAFAGTDATWRAFYEALDTEQLEELYVVVNAYLDYRLGHLIPDVT